MPQECSIQLMEVTYNVTFLCLVFVACVLKKLEKLCSIVGSVMLTSPRLVLLTSRELVLLKEEKEAEETCSQPSTSFGRHKTNGDQQKSKAKSFESYSKEKCLQQREGCQFHTKKKVKGRLFCQFVFHNQQTIMQSVRKR